ncbi:uncharacterized protein LOC131429332 [Malaya genurostris]|uniref:uncharacterized protein LOC131429332 n=1 Tax=Malaya genurostris TaxID=325434 RepID=UPI0026F391B5|nr:uncharacterized protein LOC131429332 [Malaya genurostris]
MWIYLALVVILLTVYRIRDRYSYWKKRGVPFLKGSFPLGNLQGIFGQHWSLLTKDCYDKLKHSSRKLGGIYFFFKPVALALDLDFVKDVLIKDFQHFHDRGLYNNEKDDPLMAHLVTLEGNKWKTLRHKLTPTFTSGKMKMMFPVVTSVAEHFQQSLEAAVATGQEIEVKDFLARYTTDVIGTCAFGLECNSLADPKAKFREMGRSIFQPNPVLLMKLLFGLMFGELAKRMHMRLIENDVSDFFMNAVKETVQHREENKIVRNDFMDLLIKLKNAEPIEDENNTQLGQLTFNEVAAQAFVFFVAGFETSSTAMTFCLYELARNQELQERARQSVLDSLESHGSMTYEAIYDMKYVENCINESLRKYPPLSNIFRSVSNNYKVEGTDIVLEKGCRLLVPVFAIHHDPELYPDPDKYDPDRFHPDQVSRRHPMAFLPFGDGPRSCIGLRFGMMQALVGMACVLQRFRFKIAHSKGDPLVLDPSNFITTPRGGVWLQFEKIVEHLAPITRRHYDYFKQKGVPYGGVFMLTSPLLYIMDLKLIKTILVKDFNYFPNRGVYFNEKDDPLSAHIFAIEGQKWKTLRNKLSPTFTSGKIKLTFPLVVEVCQRFCEHLSEVVQTSNDVEMHDLLSRYTIDVIGTCAFGIECNSFRDPDNEFRKYGKLAFDKLPHSPLVVYLMKAFRKYANALGMKQLHEDVTLFFSKVVRDTIDYREKNHVVRNDFMDLLLKLKNTGRLEEAGEEIGKLSFAEIAAQAFIFFTAGYDTSSTAMTYTLYELALNQKAQEKARKCVLDIFTTNNGNLSYESVSNMGYLDQCINETLRKHPPVAILERNADKDYRIPNSDLVIQKGRKIMIPTYAMHHDPEHFPDPEAYNPDRFSPEEVAKRDPYCFLPFGEGPRICIGMRFGQIQARVGLATLLRSFRFSVCDKTQIPVRYSRTNFILGPANGVWLKVERLVHLVAMDLFLLFAAVALLVAYGYYRLRKLLTFWADRNVPHNPVNFKRNLDPTIHMGRKLQQYYHQFKGQYPFAGHYFFIKPVALAIDLELLKCIFVKDFQYFHDRGTYYNEKDDPLSAHLFNLQGTKWRNLRMKISPTFTSGKMKMMYPAMIKAGKQFSDYMQEKVLVESEFELKDLLARFTTDVIGICAFGIECNSMKDPNAQFRQMGRRHFEDPRSRLKDIMCMVAPGLSRFLGLKQIIPELSDFFMNVVRETVDYRVKNNVNRNDFMDMLIAMMKSESSDLGPLTFNEIAAQAFVFFVAGFETSSTTMTWALYELSINPDIQKKGRQCVQEILSKYNGELTYEAIMEMSYIDQIIQETLRKYPPVPVHFRVVSKDYLVPGTDTTLPAGTSVMIPVYAVHHDPEIFPDPQKFDPDRFTADAIAQRHPYAWTPFGEGPRICVGMRFGLMQARIGLALLLKSFRFSSGEKSTVPLDITPKSFILAPAEGLWLKVEKI